MSDSWQDVPDESNDVTGYRDPATEFAHGLKEADDLGLVDIGALGSWSVSSCKEGSGVKELREDSSLSYWQSDGTLPHNLDVHFSKKVTISRLSLFTDYTQDESYTPSKIHILSGNGLHDLVEVVTLDLEQPSGWTHVIFDDIEDTKDGLKTLLVRINISANHQHGKDTHLRSVKIFSSQPTFTINSTVLGPFTSMKLISESSIR